MEIKAVLTKKVGGVPVIYPVGAFVLIMAVIALRMKPAAVPDVSPDANAADAPGSGGDSELFPAATNGTVIAAPQPPVTPEVPYEDNSTWMRKAVAFLIAHGKNPGSAQLAIQHYLDGATLTYDEGVMRDMAIREYGLPPDISPAGGTLARPGAVRTPLPVKPRTPTVTVKPKIVPKTAPAPTPPKYPGILRIGSTGTYVKMVQQRIHVTADGKFGPVTANAVKVFQRSHGLTADGIVGPLTWRKMFG